MGRKPALLVPLVNINGTSAEALVQQNIGVLDACRALIAALREAAPHGRDYQTYTQPPDAFRQAQEQHTRWIKAVEEIQQGAEKTALAIREQTKGRK